MKGKFNMKAPIQKKVREKMPASASKKVEEIKCKLDDAEKLIQKIISAGASAELEDFDDVKIMKLCEDANAWNQKLLQFSSGISQSIE